MRESSINLGPSSEKMLRRFCFVVHSFFGRETCMYLSVDMCACVWVLSMAFVACVVLNIRHSQAYAYSIISDTAINRFALARACEKGYSFLLSIAHLTVYSSWLTIDADPEPDLAPLSKSHTDTFLSLSSIISFNGATLALLLVDRNPLY